MERGEPLLSAVSRFACTESIARCNDPTLAAVCELYGPPLSDDTVREVTLPASLLARFGLPAQERVVAVEPLLKLKLHREAITQVVDDEEKAAVRDWLLGRSVNRQLLLPLRRGLARLLRRMAPPHPIHRPDIAQPRGLLQWRKPYLNTHPPICLEEIDAEGDGIVVRREIGLLAFDLHRYSTATGVEARGLEANLVEEARLLPFFFAAADYGRQMRLRLEKQLGLSLEQLALSLYLWGRAHFDLQPAISLPLPDRFREWLDAAPAYYLPLDRSRQVVYWQQWQYFFDDCFKLRENVYDGARLRDLAQPVDPAAVITGIDARRIDKVYRWDKRLFRKVIEEWQEVIQQAIRLDDRAALSPVAQKWLARLTRPGAESLPLADLPLEVLTELAHQAPQFYRRLQVYAAVDRGSRNTGA